MNYESRFNTFKNNIAISSSWINNWNKFGHNPFNSFSNQIVTHSISAAFSQLQTQLHVKEDYNYLISSETNVYWKIWKYS